MRALEPSDRHCKVPHMGWNSLDGALEGPLFAGLAPGEPHVFHPFVRAGRRREADVAAWTDHGGRFAAAVRRGNIAGVQFHPEKSQAAGIRLLANFLEWRP